MKRLYLLRHAKSDWSDPGLDDFDRPLAPRGRRAGALMGDYLARVGLRPDFVLCSPARRARETLGLALAALDGVPVQFEQTLYVFDHPPLLDRLRRLDEGLSSVLVVGHNPALEDLARALAGPASRAGAYAELTTKYPTAGLALLDCPGLWANLGPGSARLTDFVTPSALTDSSQVDDPTASADERTHRKER